MFGGKQSILHCTLWTMAAVPRASGATSLQKSFPQSTAAMVNPVQTSCFPHLGLWYLLCSPLEYGYISASPSLCSASAHPAAGLGGLSSPSVLPPGPPGGLEAVIYQDTVCLPFPREKLKLWDALCPRVQRVPVIATVYFILWSRLLDRSPHQEGDAYKAHSHSYSHLKVWTGLCVKCFASAEIGEELSHVKTLVAAT